MPHTNEELNLLEEKFALGVKEEDRKGAVELATRALRTENVRLILVVRACHRAAPRRTEKRDQPSKIAARRGADAVQIAAGRSTLMLT